MKRNQDVFLNYIREQWSQISLEEYFICVNKLDTTDTWEMVLDRFKENVLSIHFEKKKNVAMSFEGS